MFFFLFYFASTHRQSFCIFCVMGSVQAFPFLGKHGYGCYSGPYQLFYADSKVKENIPNGKSWDEDWDITGLEFSGKKIFLSLKYWLGLSKNFEGGTNQIFLNRSWKIFVKNMPFKVWYNYNKFCLLLCLCCILSKTVC